MSTSMNNPGPDGLRLRPMREDDLPTVMLTERRSYTLPWSEAAFQRELGDISNSHLLIVEDLSSEDAGGERHIVGHGCWWEVVDECHITNVTVSPDVRRRGVGQFLLEGIIDQARRRGIDRRGRIRHDGGVVEAAGMYLMGIPFLRRRKSSLIDGAADDARDLSTHLAAYLDGAAPRPAPDPAADPESDHSASATG